MKVTIISDIMWYHVPVIQCDKKGTSPLWYSFQKLIIPVNHMGRQQANLDLGALYRIPASMKNKEKLRSCHIAEKAGKT